MMRWAERALVFVSAFLAGVLSAAPEGERGPAMPNVSGVYYVAPSGSDGSPGTFDQPFLSLERGMEAVEPGGIVYLRGGTYRITGAIEIRASGQADAPIRIFAFPGETPILDGAAMTHTGYWSGWILVLSEVSYLHLKGIEIAYGPEGGLVLRGQSHDNILEALNVHHNGRLSEWEGKGISLLGEVSNTLLLNNDSHHNRDRTGRNADGFQLSVRGPGNVLRGNRAWLNSDDGFDLFNIYDNTATEPVLLEFNYAWENGYDDDGNPLGDGDGFKLGGSRPGTTTGSGGNIARNNTAWDNLNRPFDQNGASTRSPTSDNHRSPSGREAFLSPDRMP